MWFDLDMVGLDYLIMSELLHEESRRGVSVIAVMLQNTQPSLLRLGFSNAGMAKLCFVMRNTYCMFTYLVFRFAVLYAAKL